MDDPFYAEDRATLGDRIIAARERAGLGTKELAQRLGVRHRTLIGWEEDASEPRSNRMQMLAGLLGVSLVWLMTGRGDGPGEAKGDAQGAASAVQPDLAGELREVRGLLSAATVRLSRLEAQHL